MVSSVGGAAGCSAAAIHSARGRGPSDAAAMQEKLFNKLDVNGDGSIDQSELGDFLNFVSSATGSKTQTDASSFLWFYAKSTPQEFVFNCIVAINTE